MKFESLFYRKEIIAKESEDASTAFIGSGGRESQRMTKQN